MLKEKISSRMILTLLYSWAFFCFLFSSSLSAQDSLESLKKLFADNDNLGKRVCPKPIQAGGAVIKIYVQTNHTAPEQIAEKIKLIRGAGDGDMRDKSKPQYLFGLEGRDLNDPDPNYFQETYGKDENGQALKIDSKAVRGLDDPFVRQVQGRIYDHARLNDAIKFGNTNPTAENKTVALQNKEAFFRDFIDQKYMQEAWNKNRGDFGDSPAAKTIQAMIDRKNDYGWIDPLKTFYKSEAWNDNDEILSLSKKISEKMLEMAAAPENQKKYQTPDLKSAYAYLNNINDRSAEDKYADNVSVPWRNGPMADSIIALQNQAKDQNMELKVMMGSRHLDGVKKLLESKGYHVEVGSNE